MTAKKTQNTSLTLPGNKPKEPSLQLKRYVWALAVVWTIVITISLVWNVFHVKHMILEEALIQAQVAYTKDIIYRSWNARHGGVYVPVTKETQPNPYLGDVHERDIKTPTGKLLTLMNPAFMNRQAHELEKQKLGVLGHFTSLNPIRPENAPDPWEAEGLRAFERGKPEVSSVDEIEGREYMRLIRPLVTEKGCLKCHAKQGYREGDVRGGISVSVPMDPFWTILHRYSLTLALAHGFLWIVGLGSIGLSTQRLRRSERERMRALEQLRLERERSEQLLLNILPAPIAERLKQGETPIADSFPDATVLFADLVGFTQLSSQIPASQLVESLNEIFTMFDGLAEQHGLEKIKTIGDTYMVVGGLPTPRTDHAEAVAQMALDMLEGTAKISTRKGQVLSVRIGIHSGPVIAGVIGTRKFIYDLWGDTVNMASRMESHGLPNCIQVTESTHALLSEKFKFEKRGVIEVKGKGEMTTYLLKERIHTGNQAS